MASVPKRYTYYGGETAVLSNNTSSSGSNIGHTQNRARRKHVTFGPYILGSTLGEGEFGKVKLGWSKQSANSSTEVSKQVAIKLIRRDTIPKNSDKEVKVYREINALKHLTHPNIVKLEEVLQNSKYIGIVLEYASGGEFYKYIQRKRRLKEGMACRLFAQLTSGVQYMHSKGLVHRDLKLENLLLDKHENLIITDFGFVNEFFQNNELMKTSCGSPCYAAPELVVSTKPYEARKADVWSCGIILYAMLAGYLPWDDDPKNPDGNDIAKLYHYITRTPLKFPEYIAPIPRDLLRRILVSDPKRRISLRNIQRHEWIKPHLPFLTITPEEWDRTMVSKGVFRPPRLNTQRSARPQSNCSMSSTNSKGEKRDSLIIDSTLVNLPAPPQESQSHVIAKPSPPSPELRHSPVRGLNRHSRSNSAASIALQAVVDAEREHNLQRDSFLHLQKTHHPSSNRGPPSFLVQRSNTHSGNSVNVSSLMNRNSIIVEASPAKDARVPVEISPQSGATVFHSSSQQSNNNTLRAKAPTDRLEPANNSAAYHSLKSHHQKPRPTSYHPSSSASADDKNGGSPVLPTIIGASNNGVFNVEYSPFDSTPSLAAEQKNRSFESSPKMLPRRSFSMSKPSLDLQSVSGDLIRTQRDGETITRRINEQVEDADNRKPRQNRRYSAIIGEKVFSPVSEETEEPFIKAKQSTKRETHGFSSRIDIENTAGNKSFEKPMDKVLPDIKLDKKRFSFLSFYSAQNVSKSSIASNDSKNAVPPKSTSRKPSSASSSSESAISKSEAQSTPSVARKNSKSSRQTSSTSQRNADRNIYTANSSRSTLTEVAAQRNPVMEASNSRITSRATNASNSSANSHRQSVMVSSLNDSKLRSHPQPQQRNTGDQSTARKVIDFFKRRSMRL